MRLGNGLRSILANGALLAGSQWVEMLIRFGYLVVITRSLGPEGYAVWNYALATYTLVIGWSALGFESVLHYAYGGSTRAGNRMAQAALFARGAIGALAALGFLVFAVTRADDQGIATALVLVAPAILFRSLAQLNRSLFVATQSVRKSFRYAVLLRLLEAALGAAALGAGAGLHAILVIHVTVWMGEWLWSSWITLGHLGVRPAIPSRAALLELVRRGAPRAVNGAMMAWMFAGPIVLFKAFSSDLAALGLFALCLQLVAMLFGAVQSFLVASIPVLAVSEGKDDPRIGIYGPVSSGIAVLVAVGAAIFLQFWGEGLIVAALGTQFAGVGLLMVPAIAIVGAQLFPVGYLQLQMLRETYRPGLLGGAAGCAVLTVGFFTIQADMTPITAIGVTLVAWAARATIIVLYGSGAKAGA